jgi:ABC-type bacteriocin/lantibiotic exporter with double-glycine peptidase domain
MLTYLLKTLNIKHTKTEARRLSDRIVNMGSWSDVLNHYRIANMAVRLQPQQLAQATFPCVAHCQDADGAAYFVVVEGVSEEQVAYHDGRKNHQ